MAKLMKGDFQPKAHGQFSPEEWDLRVNLAACYRLMDRFGMTDMIYNHISARVPGTDHFFHRRLHLIRAIVQRSFHPLPIGE